MCRDYCYRVIIVKVMIGVIARVFVVLFLLLVCSCYSLCSYVCCLPYVASCVSVVEVDSLCLSYYLLCSYYCSYRVSDVFFVGCLFSH